MFAEWERERLIAALDAAGVPCGPINSVADVFKDPQVKARGMLKHVPHPSGVDVPQVATPMRFADAPAADADRAAAARPAQRRHPRRAGLRRRRHRRAARRRSDLMTTEAALVAEVALRAQGDDLRARAGSGRPARTGALGRGDAQAERAADAGQPAVEDPDAGARRRLHAVRLGRHLRVPERPGRRLAVPEAGRRQVAGAALARLRRRPARRADPVAQRARARGAAAGR